MPDPWEYQPRQSYLATQRALFEQEARKVLLRHGLLSQRTRPYGSVSTYAAQTNPAFQGDYDLTSKEPPEPGGSGFLRKISPKRIRDLPEFVFRGPLRKPWDVLRPAVQALDWEHKHIARNLVRGAFATAAVLGRGLRGESPARSWEMGWEEYNELPAAIRVPAEILYSPSTWLGPGLLTKAAAKSATVLARVPVIGGFLGRPAAKLYLKAIRGGAPEPEALTKMLNASARFAPEGEFHLRTLDEVHSTLALMPSFRLSKRLAVGPAGHLLRKLGLNAYERPHMAMVIERESLIARGDSLAAAWVHNYMEAPFRAKDAAGRPLIQFDRTGKYIENLNKDRAVWAGLNPRPAYDELGEKLNDYVAAGALSPQQAKVLRVAAEPIAIVRELVEKATGKKLALRRGDLYFHREAVSKTVLTSAGEQRVIDLTQGRHFNLMPGWFRPKDPASMAAMEARGVRYMDFASAQREYIRQGFHIIADTWFKNAVAHLGRTPGQLMPEALKSAVLDTGTRYGWARAVNAELTQAIKNPVPNSFRTVTKTQARRFYRQAGDVPADIASFLDRAKQASGLSRRADRRDALKALKEEFVQAVLLPSKSAAQVARHNVQVWSRGITRGAHGGTPEFSDYISKLGRYFPADIAEQLRAATDPERLGSVMHGLSQINNALRPLQAVFDLSFLAVQGIIGAATHPLRYARAVAHGFGINYSEFLLRAEKTGLLQTYLRAGGTLIAEGAGYGEWLVRPGIAGRVPGVGIANRMFIRFGNSMRIKMFEAGLPFAKTLEQQRQLARVVQFATGFVTGEATALERAAVFAPRYFRSQMSLIGEAIAGGGLAAQKARGYIFRMIAMGGLLTYLINETRGYDTQLDPRKPGFMRIRNVAGRHISLWGPWDTLVRATVQAATGDPIGAAAYVARAKASPVLQPVWSIIKGETWSRQKIDWSSLESTAASIARLASQYTPIVLQESLIEPGVEALVGLLPGVEPTGQSLQDIYGPGLSGMAKGLAAAAIDLAGTKSQPISPWEARSLARDDLAKREYQRSWTELEPHEQAELANRFPEVAEDIEPRTPEGMALRERRQIFERHQASMEALEASIRSGEGVRPGTTPQQAFLYGMRIRREQLNGALTDWDARYPDLVMSESEALERYKDNPQRLALEQYRWAFRKSRNPVTGQLDHDRLDLELSRLYDQWQKEGHLEANLAYIERNTGIRDTPYMREYRQAQKTLRPYWEVEDQIWELVVRSRPRLASYRTFRDYENEVKVQLAVQGYEPFEVERLAAREPVIAWVNTRVSRLRERMRRADPAIDKALELWYGYVPIREHKRGRKLLTSARLTGSLVSRG